VDELVARLAKAEKDPAVRAVVLRINSPGGTVTGSHIMHAEVRRFAEESGKPVVACLSEIAASGGFYLALAADEIVAQPTTITGSIGVIIQTVNVSTGLAKIGVYARSVTSGPNKALASPFEPAKDEHYAILQGVVDQFYGRFRGLVHDRRPGVSEADLATYTDGRIVTGADAARVGLVDRTGDLRDAFEAAKSRAGLTHARLIKYHDRGASPRSAYARAGVPAPSAGAAPGGNSTTLNLLQVNVAGSLAAAAGANFYYLWLPETP
jgi:protease-4